MTYRTQRVEDDGVKRPRRTRHAQYLTHACEARTSIISEILRGAPQAPPGPKRLCAAPTNLHSKPARPDAAAMRNGVAISLFRGAPIISRRPSGFPRRGAPGRDRAVASRHVAEGSRGDHVPVVAVSHGRQRRRSAGIAAPPRAARTLPLYPERYETYKAEWPRGERASAARRGGARQRPLTPSRGGAPRGRAQPRGCTVPVLARGAPGATSAQAFTGWCF